MAQKEATVYIIDLGPTMGQRHHGRAESDLAFGLRYVWEKLAAVVASERKTLNVGVLALNTDATDNPLARGPDGEPDDDYAAIATLLPLGPVRLDNLRQLRAELRPRPWGGDADPVSAVVVAVDMITTFTKKLKYARKIVLVTNGRPASGAAGTQEAAAADADSDADADPDGSLAEIGAKLDGDGIELVVLGIDFDDPAHTGFAEPDKPAGKRARERALARLCRRSDAAVFATMAEALAQTGARPQLRTVRPVPMFSGTLALGRPGPAGDGDGAAAAACFEVEVEQYRRVAPEPAPTASSYVLSAEAAAGAAAAATTAAEAAAEPLNIAALALGDGGPDALAAVKQMRSYTVPDPAGPGGRRDVPFEDLAKGYEFGSTIVPISESDQAVLTLKTEPGIQIVGFVPLGRLPPYLSLNKPCALVPSRSSLPSQLGFTALLQALWATDSAAVARQVLKPGRPATLVALIPSPHGAENTDGLGDADEAGKCLVLVDLPFAEDVRPFDFPPLAGAAMSGTAAVKAEPTVKAEPVVVKAEPAVKTEPAIKDEPDESAESAESEPQETHFIPSTALMSAMDEFVDAMEMSDDDDDNDDNGDDDLNKPSFPELIGSHNPYLYRLKSAIRARALDPDRQLFPDDNDGGSNGNDDGNCNGNSSTAAFLADLTPAYSLRYQAPSEARSERAQDPLARLAAVAGITPVEKSDRAAGKGRRADETAPIEELDLEELGFF